MPFSRSHAPRYSQHCVFPYPRVLADTVTQFLPVEYGKNNATDYWDNVTRSLATAMRISWHVYAWGSSSWNLVNVMFRLKSSGKTLRLTVPSQLVLNSNLKLGLMNLYKAMLSYSPSYQTCLELEDIPRGKIVWNARFLSLHISLYQVSAMQFLNCLISHMLPFMDL